MEKKKTEKSEFDLVALFLEKGEEDSVSGAAAIDEALKIAVENGAAIFFSSNIHEVRAEDIGIKIYVSGGLEKFFIELGKLQKDFEAIYFMSTRENEERVRKDFQLKVPQVKRLKYWYKRKSKK